MGEKYNSKFYPDLYKKDVYYYNYEDMLGNNNRAKIENNYSNQITISQKSNHDSSIQNEKNNQSNSNRINRGWKNKTRNIRLIKNNTFNSQIDSERNKINLIASIEKRILSSNPSLKNNIRKKRILNLKKMHIKNRNY